MTFRVEPELRTSFAEAAEHDRRPAAQVLRELVQQTGQSLIDALQASPHRDIELAPPRAAMPASLAFLLENKPQGG